MKRGFAPDASELDHAIGDLTMIDFYYLLRIGDYTTKGVRNNSKQTEEFKLVDITFFSKDARGQLRCLPRDTPMDLILAAEGATMKLDNQKNGWKGVCVYQECNGDPIHCPVRPLGRRTALKQAATALEYPLVKGIPIERINTHSLWSGGANALALSGYSDTQIQKMGCWRGATFKEYVQNELACFSSGMSRDMKTKFGFVNVSGNAFSDITDACINANYFASLTVAVM